MFLAGNQCRCEARSDPDIWKEAKDEKEAIQLKITAKSIQPQNQSIHRDWTYFV